MGGAHRHVVREALHDLVQRDDLHGDEEEEEGEMPEDMIISFSVEKDDVNQILTATMGIQMGMEGMDMFDTGSEDGIVQMEMLLSSVRQGPNCTSGNCELTKPGEYRVYKKVTIIGFTDLPSRLPTQASQLFSNNVTKLIQYLNEAGKFKLDLEDEITGAITVVHDGKVLLKSENKKTSNEKFTQFKKTAIKESII